PRAPLRTRLSLGSMGPGGALPSSFFRSEPQRLDALGIRFVQVPSDLLAENGAWDGRPERIDVVVEPGQPRFFPLPMSAGSEVVLSTSLADAVSLPQGAEVAQVD